MPFTAPTPASSNTNLDNGMSSGEFSVEQFSLAIDQYNDTIDLNMVTADVAIASVFVENASVNGTQAKQSLDRLARNQLYFGSVSPLITDVGGYPTRIRLLRPHGFIDDEGRHRRWYPGIITAPDDIAVICGRGVPHEVLEG